MKIFNIISGVCSILGLIISLIVANKVVKMYNTLNFSNNSNNKIKQNAKGSNINQAGRDNVVR